MKLFITETHIKEKSHVCIIKEFGNVGNGGKFVKLTYEAYNGVERFTTEIFDGVKWNHCVNMLDLGELPNTSAYNIWDEKKRKERANELILKAEKVLTLLLK